jgi:hypothetical protein
MLKLLLTLVLVGTLGSLSVTDVSSKLYDDLLAYHAGRVDLPHRHETEEQRQERIRWIADAIPQACADFPFDMGWTFEQCVALVSAGAKWESGLLKEVHAGDRRGPAGERCLLQLHRLVSAVPDPKYRVTPEELAATVGLSAEATYHCALAGVKTFAWQIHRCRIHGNEFTAAAAAFSLYHHPSTNCEYVLSGMPAMRAKSYRALLAKLH